MIPERALQELLPCLTSVFVLSLTSTTHAAKEYTSAGEAKVSYTP